MIVWNGLTTHKLFIIPLKSPWVLTCAYSPDGNYVASAGLDNILYLYELKDEEFSPSGVRELKGHEGSISFCKFVDEERIITCAGDNTSILWNIEDDSILTQFFGHTQDVLCLDINYNDKNSFISAGIDKTARLWDIRTGATELSYSGHPEDINTIKYFPDYNAFATGSDDGTVKLFDIRGDRELFSYSPGDGEEPFKIVSICFSNSGGYLFGACHHYTNVWNTLSGEKMGELLDKDVVSCVGVNPTGLGLYTSCWNGFINIYA